MPIDIRNVNFGERGFPVEDLTAKTKYEQGFRIGKFDFPCIAVSDIDKFVSAIVINRMEMPEHLYHGYLVVAPLLTKMKRYGELFAEDNTAYNKWETAYLWIKSLLIVLANKKTVTHVTYEVKKDAGAGQKIKITYIIDGGSETTLLDETITETAYTWHTKTCELTGDTIIINVYLLGADDEARNRGFGVFGTLSVEESGEKFTVDHGEYI